jgi:hypothetical protein
VLEANPADHAGGEALVRRAFQAFAVKARRDLIVIAIDGQLPDPGNDVLRIAHGIRPLRRQRKLDRLGCAALPADLQ